MIAFLKSNVKTLQFYHYILIFDRKTYIILKVDTPDLKKDYFLQGTRDGNLKFSKKEVDECLCKICIIYV